ncbi:hypothetical protein [Niallia sp. MER 6]|uniref:hypothetical protein n=1 Tax=Niallia sp. MER 6 TaxID=2939567 RepID=UPI00203EA948|nr:hypothetical protein [Niallia sp. MER 6]MCM3034161.1 hypothetical protein [Niallia sp. MER 6]
MKKSLWTSEIRFISGNKEILEFADEEKAIQFYNILLSTQKGDFVSIFLDTGLTETLININNIETITKPKKMMDISTLI